jgi:hypothetical protein
VAFECGDDAVGGGCDGRGGGPEDGQVPAGPSGAAVAANVPASVGVLGTRDTVVKAQDQRSLLASRRT